MLVPIYTATRGLIPPQGLLCSQLFPNCFECIKIFQFSIALIKYQIQHDVVCVLLKNQNIVEVIKWARLTS